MTFYLHTSNRMELLSRCLADFLQSSTTDIFDQETVIISGSAMARWLQLEIAKEHGVCANLELPFLKNFLWQNFLRPLIEDDQIDQEAVKESQLDFSQEVMTWQIMKFLPRVIRKESFYSLSSYLQSQDKSLKSYQLASRMAKLFDHYQIYRPEMMVKWANGQNLWSEEENSLWQMRIWQELIKEKGPNHFPGLFLSFMDKMSSDCPEEIFPILKEENRLFLFGFSSLPPLFVKMFQAISSKIDVHLFFLNPCQEYWEDQYSERAFLKRGLDHSQEEQGNSLLKGWGQQNREFLQVLLQETQFNDQPLYPKPYSENLLERVQADIQKMDSPKSKQIIAYQDRSIQFHLNYSPMREVEDLYQYLLYIFANSEDVEPKDVLVLVPDIETYAPYVEAVFNTIPRSDPCYIPTSISDRSFSSSYQEVEAYLRLIKLLKSRFSAPDILEILQYESVYRNLAFSEEDVQIAASLLKRAGISWGIDKDFRKEVCGIAFEENSWAFGLKRMLLGYAMSPRDQCNYGLFYDQNNQPILPEDSIEGESVRIVGEIAEFSEKLFSAFWEVQEQSPDQESAFLSPSQFSKFTHRWWANFFIKLLDVFFLQDGPFAEGCQAIRSQILELTGIMDKAGYEEDDLLSLETMWQALKDGLSQQTTTSGFLKGGVTFCRLTPMRCIPAKIICLLGMNESSFPRADNNLSFDLLVKDPRPCDRSNRKDDLGIFLETILSARKLLYISYLGRDIKTDQELPPSPIVSQFMDYLDLHYQFETQEEETDRKLSNRLTVHHPLQPFSRKFFERDHDGRKKHPGLVSYDQKALSQAKIIQIKQVEPAKEKFFFPEEIKKPLAETSSELSEISFQDLYLFFRSPCQYLLEKRLNINLRQIQSLDQPEETEPFILGGLDTYTLKDEILEDCFLTESKTIDQLRKKFKACGRIPVGACGEDLFLTLYQEVAQLGSELSRFIISPCQPIPLSIPFPELGTTLKTELNQIYQVQGDNQINLSQIFCKCGKENERDIIWAWLSMLVANSPEAKAVGQWEAMPTTCFFEDKRISYQPLDYLIDSNESHPEKKELQNLIDLYLQGLKSPLPFYPTVSWTLVKSLLHNDHQKAWKQAALIWDPNSYWNYKSVDQYTIYCFGQTMPEDETWRNNFEITSRKIFEKAYQFRKEDKKR